ncbi:hypothetical protein C0991_007509 [Blastosporella zonata]|nr:hypothetical protein C0991_007509 [Blastosporella zonata]
MSSDDEYASLTLPTYTNKELEAIDAHVQACLSAPAPAGQPQITIEIADESEPVSQSPTVVVPEDLSALSATAKGKGRRGDCADLDALSPMERYRRHGVLNVTDLVSLAWCEVQYDYGLRQRRSMPIASRPTSFISAQGKEISVAKEVAAANDVVTKQGTALHKVLERLVKPEELRVDISSEEEQWALRLVNMLTSLQCIALEGYTRELPVFGIIQGVVVNGIIDEVLMKTEGPLTPQKRTNDDSTSPRKRKKPRRSVSPSQHFVTDFLPSSTSADPPTSSYPDNQPLPLPIEADPTQPRRPDQPQPPSTGLPRRFLHLIDTKTRESNSVPHHKDTLSGRMQLMIYYRLLKDMISTSPLFNFAAVWRRLGVDPAKTFSTRFLIQAGLMGPGSTWKTSCLNDLSQAYLDTVRALDVAGVNTTLQLVYRLQGKVGNKKGKGKCDKGRWKGKEKRASKKRTGSPVVTQEERDLARAIEASLLDARKLAGSVLGTPVSISTDTPTAPTTHSDVEGTNGTDSAQISSRSPTSASSSDSEVDKFDLRPIGTKEFEYEEETLDRHIAHTLQWWRGERSSQGVSLEDSGRCWKCEYRDDCEWREQKALEVQERMRGRR